ncbi:hypothetical protein NDU88_007853, partial [Pleurodeles waltl]
CLKRPVGDSEGVGFEPGSGRPGGGKTHNPATLLGEHGLGRYSPQWTALPFHGIRRDYRLLGPPSSTPEKQQGEKGLQIT